MRDLLTNPCWSEADLGEPLPDSAHAVSVAMPRWQDVIGYEEENPAVLEKLRCGYPRFFLPPLLQQLFVSVRQRFGRAGEECIAFPSPEAAARCLDFIGRRTQESARIEPVGPFGLTAVFFPESIRRTARLYWRFSGETVNTRQALCLLENRTPDIAAGQTAKQTIRKRLAHLAGTSPADVFLFPSGMAAVFAVHRMLREAIPGKRSVQLDFPYVDVLKVQEEFGEGTLFHPTPNAGALAEIRQLARTGEACGVFCEIPSNPLLRSARLSEFIADLQQNGVPFILDDTVATVVNIDALSVADAAITSLTKSFSGNGDVLAGAVTLNPKSPRYAEFQRFLTREFASNDIFWPEDAVALEINSRDFPKRVRRTSQNAAALAGFLRSHPSVAEVYYPGPGDGLDEILRPGADRGCLLSFVLHNAAAAPAVFDQLRICKGPSLGTNYTLACPYTLLVHYQELDWAERCGVPRHLIRVSVGLEETDDLLARFTDALHHA